MDRLRFHRTPSGRGSRRGHSPHAGEKETKANATIDQQSRGRTRESTSDLHSFNNQVRIYSGGDQGTLEFVNHAAKQPASNRHPASPLPTHRNPINQGYNLNSLLIRSKGRRLVGLRELRRKLSGPMSAGFPGDPEHHGSERAGSRRAKRHLRSREEYSRLQQ